MAEAQSLNFKAKEKAVLGLLLTIPEVSQAVKAQLAGRSQEAKALMRAAVPHFPREILERAGAGQSVNVEVAGNSPTPLTGTSGSGASGTAGPTRVRSRSPPK